MNFVLHDMIVAALVKAVDEETAHLTNAKNADFAELKFRIGRIHGLNHACEIAQETMTKYLEDK